MSSNRIFHEEKTRWLALLRAALDDDVDLARNAQGLYEKLHRSLVDFVEDYQHTLKDDSRDTLQKLISAIFLRKEHLRYKREISFIYASLSDEYRNDVQFKPKFWAAVDRCWRRCIQPQDMEQLYDVFLCLFSVTVATFPLDLDVFERLHLKATKHHKYKYLKALPGATEDAATPRKPASSHPDRQHDPSLPIGFTHIQPETGGVFATETHVNMSMQPPSSSPRPSPSSTATLTAAAGAHSHMLLTDISLTGELLPDGARAAAIGLSAQNTPVQRRTRPKSVSTSLHGDVAVDEAPTVTATGKQITRTLQLHGKSAVENVELYHAQPVADEVIVLGDHGGISVHQAHTHTQTPRRESGKVAVEGVTRVPFVGGEDGGRMRSTSGSGSGSGSGNGRSIGVVGAAVGGASTPQQSFWLPYETPHGSATPQRQQTPRSSLSSVGTPRNTLASVGTPSKLPLSVSLAHITEVEDEARAGHACQRFVAANVGSGGSGSDGDRERDRGENGHLTSMFSSLSMSAPPLDLSASDTHAIALPHSTTHAQTTPRALATPRKKTGLPMLAEMHGTRTNTPVLAPVPTRHGHTHAGSTGTMMGMGVRADQYIDSVQFASVDLDDLGDLDDSQLPTTQQHRWALHTHGDAPYGEDGDNHGDAGDGVDAGYGSAAVYGDLSFHGPHATPRKSGAGSSHNGYSGPSTPKSASIGNLGFSGNMTSQSSVTPRTSQLASTRRNLFGTDVSSTMSSVASTGVSALTARTGTTAAVNTTRQAAADGMGTYGLSGVGLGRISDLNDTRTITAKNKVPANKDSSGRMYDIARGSLLERPALPWGQGLLLKIVNVQVNDKDNFITPRITMYVCDGNGNVTGEKQDTHGPRLRRDGRLHYNCYMWVQKMLSSFRDDDAIVLELNHYKSDKGGYISTKQWTMVTLPLLVRIKNGGTVSLPVYAKPVNTKKPKQVSGLNIMVEVLTEDKYQSS